MKQLYRDGRWVPSQSGRTRAIINPFNQDVLDDVAEGDRDDSHLAVRGARTAFDDGPWPGVPPAERAHLLARVADLIRRDQGELARIETLDTGKTLTESRADMENIEAVFRYYASMSGHLCDTAIDSPIPNSSSTVVREPIGVCGLITPWNYPLLQAAWKIAPALLAGNTLVIKPSEITPLSTIKMIELLEEAALPPGVAQLVLGPGDTVGNELTTHPDVDMVSFTGGIETGSKIMRDASRSIKKIALELGGKNPNVVFADCDFDAAVDHALNAVFYHAGQVCSAGSRLLIADSLHDRFVGALLTRMRRIRLGSGLDETTQCGPLISDEHRRKVEHYVAVGLEEGANLVAGGARPEEPELQRGFFYLPTMFTDCRADMRIVQEEIFGPVMTVERFADEAEAVRLANDTVYGLAGAVWSQDIEKANRVARRMRMGTVWINDFHPYFAQAPWGGYKRSGIGRELSVQGLDEYTEIKHLFRNLKPRPANWFG